MSVKSTDGPRRKRPVQSRKTGAAGTKASAVMPDNTFIQFAEQANDAILIIDSEGSCVFANRRSAEMLGYGIAELLRMGYRDMVLPDDLERAGEAFARRIAGNSVEKLHEARVVGKGGDVFAVEVSGTKITWKETDAVMVIARDMRERTAKGRQLFENEELRRTTLESSGNRMLNEGSFEDMTDRVMMEKALRSSEEQFRLIFENLGNSTMIIEEDTTISMMNSECEKLSGYSKDEVEGKKRFVDFVDTEEAARLRNLHARRLRDDGETPIRYETCFYTKDGTRKDVLATVILLPGTRRCIDSVIDITARKQAERRLSQSEETTRTLLNATDASALLIDGHGTIVAANRTAAEAVGRVESDLVGRNFGDYVSPRLARVRKGKLNQTLALKHPVRYTEKIDGRLMDVTVYPVLDARGNISLCTVYSHDVTEQRAAEEALRKSEEKYRSHFENVRDVIFSIDSDMLVTSVSPSVERSLGYSPDELAGKYFHNLLFLLQPEYRDKGYRNVLRLLAGEQLGSGIYGFMRKDGRKVFCEISGSPYFRDGKVVGFVSVVRDITDRKKTEDALRESELRYRQIVEYAPAGIYEIDFVKEKFTSVNDVMCEYSGYTREELLQMHFAEIFTEESGGVLKTRLEKLRENEPVADTAEYCICSKEGRTIWVLMNARYMYENGLLKGSSGVVYNITARKNAEEEITKSEERLRTVLESMPVMLTATDERGRIAVWNAACERVTGYSLEEMRGRSDFLEVLYPDPSYRAELLLEQESNGGVFYNRETALTCKGGSLKTVSWSNISKDYPIPGWDMWAVGLDITEIKKAEEVLVNVNIELGRQVEERTKELNIKAGKLEETNAALRTLLKTAEDFKEDMERRILANITQIIMPYLERLKKSQLSTDQMTYCNILETHIRNITSPFAKRLSPPYLNFTPQEIKIATLIREHKTTKDIAKLLNISESAVIFHRHNIRKKLGVVSKRVNLEAYLQSFS